MTKEEEVYYALLDKCPECGCGLIGFGNRDKAYVGLIDSDGRVACLNCHEGNSTKFWQWVDLVDRSATGLRYTSSFGGPDIGYGTAIFIRVR